MSCWSAVVIRGSFKGCHSRNWRGKIPKKCEKPELERSGRVISGFNINRKWDAKQLHGELSTLLTGEIEGMFFEIVKNAGGTVLSPTLPKGKEIDA